MIRRVGKYLLWATVMAVFALVGVMAFMRRDHKVELVVTYPQSPPAAIWRLLTDHAAEPRWLRPSDRSYDNRTSAAMKSGRTRRRTRCSGSP